MQNNRRLSVYSARSRKDTVLQAAPTDVLGLFQRLGSSQVIPYTIEAYKALRKPQQDDLKDVGAFIAGELKNGRRRRGCVLSRSAIVLDADNLPAGGTEDFIRRVAALNMCCCVYSTAKHSLATPRLRLVAVLKEDIPAEQYALCARLLCRLIQPEMTWFDPSTDEAGRIMYYGAHCQDVEPVYYTQDGAGFLDADSLLSQLQDWENPATWPTFPRETAPAQIAAKQEDPTGKSGIVGAFCRCYDVPAAMDKFIPGIYEPAGEGRYTFTGGSTYAGAVLYDNGKFLYSHHATDPAGGKLVNAWDLVRLHRFGELDDEAKEGVRGNRLPSYAAMCELARSDGAVSDELAREALASAQTDFQDEEAAQELAHRAQETFDLDVLRIALRAIGVQVRRNLISGKLEIRGMPAPYSEESAPNTLPTILWDMMIPLKIKGAGITAIQKALATLADENRYNPVLDMLHSIEWDGVSRLQVLLDIIGIDGGSFYALLVRKWLIQCVAMAHNTRSGRLEAAEGVLTLQGDQGIGKTTFFRRLAVKPEWLAEGLSLDMKNKDSIIQATGVWIAELGELESTLKKEQAELKSFITQKVDRIRAPYASEPEERPRHTSFGATVNQEQFLKDETGDRRFWVIPVKTIDLARLIDLPDEWFEQMWAEVYIWWLRDPRGFRLDTLERAHLNELNQWHREMLPGEEEIRTAFHWELPPEQWGEFTPVQLRERLFYGVRITAQQIGRVLAKLAREDKRITVYRDSRSNVKTYKLPITLLFAEDAETNSKAL